MHQLSGGPACLLYLASHALPDVARSLPVSQVGQSVGFLHSQARVAGEEDERNSPKADFRTPCVLCAADHPQAQVDAARWCGKQAGQAHGQLQEVRGREEARQLHGQDRAGEADFPRDSSRRLSIAVSGSMRRQREQLVTLGKLDRAVTVKAEFNNVSRWAHHVPSSVPFTVEGLLKALVQGKVKPLYDVDGKHKAAAQPDESS